MDFYRQGRVGMWFLCTLAGACAGCSNKIPTYPVRGKVVYKDGTPIRGGGGLMIWFESTASPYHRASGLVEANGEFVLSFIEAGSGAPEGEHRIRFDPGTEQSRIRHRDRKRETRMVVDNAGVKRVVPAVRRRRRADDTPGASGRTAPR